MSKSKEAKAKPKRRYWKWVLLLWAAILSPFVGIAMVLLMISQGIFFEELPTFEELENPRSNQASVIYSADGEILGKYYRENRNDVYFQDLSPHVVTALVSTEDERYRQHSGIDLRGLARAIAYGGGNGGASTITQQLAKMLFHSQPTGKVGRIVQKLKEWIIAVRLERQYTKEEILTMYLNKFDFINNAVGIRSAAQVYFGTTPQDLELHEAAMLVGMAKNPSLFNPIRRPDTTLHRRNVVFAQMMRNQQLTRTEFDSLKQLDLGIDYHRVDHKEGLAPYFREELRQKLGKLFSEKNEDGEYVYQEPDGKPYSNYRDGIRVSTTIASRMQRYAEYAVRQHLGGELQNDFWRNIKKFKSPPFSNRVNAKQIENIMQRARKNTDRYRVLAGKQCANCGRRGKYIDQKAIEGIDYYVCNADDCGHKHLAISADSLQRNFDTPVPMKVFSWKGDIDTIMSPNDSIRYYKSFLQAGMMAMDPHNG
ncbi:MAG: transglycosylase domain-containing protein, partial [Salibacteraceae bacterium]